MPRKTKKKSKIFTKNTLIWAVSIFAALVILMTVYLLGIQSPVRETVFFRVDPGASITTVGKRLKDQGLINYEDLFKASVLLQGNRIQSGVYELRPGVSMSRIAKMLNHGQIASVDVVIPEGYTVKQIKKMLLQNSNLTGPVECDLGAGVPNVDKPVCHLSEGDLFPDTYRVPRGMDRLAVLELSRKKMDSIRMGWENSGKSMPAPLKDWNEIVTLASIIQKETPKVSEMPIVASVYLNRLKKKMRLQADPTVVYAITNGLGDMQGKGLFKNHLKADSPYNTYVHYGLPPAPIANVGRNAIAAVLNPADTSYLFFVADGQGGHKFARSYEEHKKNHADWRAIKKTFNTAQ